MATLPRQIQAQLDAANALLAQAQNPTPPAPPEPSVEVPPPPSPPAPPEPPIVPQPTPQPPAPAPATPPQDYEHKYKVLQGMFSQQKTQLQQMSERLQELTAQLTRLQAQPPAPASTPAPEPTANPKDVNAFGEDMMEMVYRVTSETLARAGQQIETRLAQIEAGLAQVQQSVQGATQTVAKTSEDLFFERLSKLAPEWAAINEDPAFLAWLAEIDPLYGVARQAALNDAYGKGDAQRAANVVKTYLSTLAPPPAPTPPVSPTPRTAGTPPPAGQQPKPIVLQAEVTRFYDDVKRGLYRGRDAERQQREDHYNAALAEGRIR